LNQSGQLPLRWLPAFNTTESLAGKFRSSLQFSGAFQLACSMDEVCAVPVAEKRGEFSLKKRYIPQKVSHSEIMNKVDMFCLVIARAFTYSINWRTVGQGMDA
jgi:hypothetical protein